MSSRPELKLDWATHKAAKYAVEHWHYSKKMPKSKLAKIGVWEQAKFIGCVIYGVGASNKLVKRYGLKPEEGCELVRVALTAHKTPCSRIIAISLNLIKKTFPKLRLIVSFADTAQGHHGGIYQAGGWIFTGKSDDERQYKVRGRWLHPRSACNYGSTTGLPKRKMPGKYRYLMPLDDEISKRIKPLMQPYPKSKACEVGDDCSNSTAAVQHRPTRSKHERYG